MKYKGSIEINRPIEIVTKLFADSNNPKRIARWVFKERAEKQIEREKGAVSIMYY